MVVADAENRAAQAATDERPQGIVVAEKRQAEHIAAPGRRHQSGDGDASLQQRIGDDAGMSAGADDEKIGRRHLPTLRRRLRQ
jgi:hypothetical protein